MKLSKLFDYVFVRAASFFFKRDGEDADRAIWFVTAIQSFVVLDMACTVNFFVLEDRGKRYHAVYFVVWASILTGLYILNRRRYGWQYAKLKEQWHEGHQQRVWRGIAIVAVFVFLVYYPLFFLTVFGKTFLNQ